MGEVCKKKYGDHVIKLTEKLKTMILSFQTFIVLLGLFVVDAQEFDGWSIENFSDFNCSIPKIIRGEWYSRESNEDARNNIIRFRRGVVFAKNDFNTVCSWVQFPNDAAWKYDIMIKKDPVPVRCPVAGAFEFVQEGDHLFQTRVIKGITKNPRHDVYSGRTGQFSCKKNISRLAVCDTDQKEITIDETYWKEN